MSELKRTPLYDEHVKLKGRLVPFAGWEMPVQYSGLMAEHEAVRMAVGLFDVSHMGEFEIKGEKAQDFLNRVTTNDVTKLQDGGCQYTLLCYENGTVVDDLIVSRFSDSYYMAVVNASNIEKDLSWFKDQNKEGVAINNISDQYALIAVQGPKSMNLVADVLDQDFSDLKYYHFTTCHKNQDDILVFRTGYTGEDGCELMVKSHQATWLWQELLEKGEKWGVLPCGLGARDTLRLEVAYSLYGHEINQEIKALEAGLGWIVKLKKGDFVGREALLKLKEAGADRKIVGFEMIDPGIARDGCVVYGEDQEIGKVTSGTYSPTLKKSIGLALVPVSYKEPGTKFAIDIRGKKKRAVVVATPFYKR